MNLSPGHARPRVVFVLHSLRMGGAERVVATLSSHWVEAKGWDVTVLTLDDGTGHHYEVHQGVTCKSLNVATTSSSALRGLVANLRRVAVLRAELRVDAPCMVIGIGSSPNILAILAGLGLQNVTIGTEHVHPPTFPLNTGWSILRRLTYRFADRVISLTKQSGDWIRHNCPGSEVTVIPNPVLFPLPSLSPRIDPDSVVSSERRVLLAMGRLCPQKGFDILIAAFARIAEKYPEWDLIIGGEGPDRAALTKLKESNKATATRVHLLDKVGNVGDWYERADLFVFSSRFEGFGLTLAEAMAYGRAVVSFDCESGPADIVRHGKDGLLVPLKDGVDGLADALGLLMGDDVRRAEMARNATDVRRRFSIETITGAWEQVFWTCESQKHSRSPKHARRGSERDSVPRVTRTTASNENDAALPTTLGRWTARRTV